MVHVCTDGGDRGFFGRGDMQKEFEEAAFKLNKGEVSGIVETASGVHLIQRFAVAPHLPMAAANVRAHQAGITMQNSRTASTASAAGRTTFCGAACGRLCSGPSVVGVPSNRTTDSGTG